MAVYIEIDKISEDDCLAVFLYRIDTGGEGKIHLDKKLGEIILLEVAPGD